MAERLVVRRDDEDDELEPKPVCVAPAGARGGRLSRPTLLALARCQDQAPARAGGGLAAPTPYRLDGACALAYSARALSF
jgi:hypothetical protein